MSNTSQPYADPDALHLESGDFALGSLRLTSYVRPGKLFTAHASLISGKVGELKKEKFTAIREAVVRMILKG